MSNNTNTISKAKLEMMRRDINNALESIAKQYNVQLKLGSGTYSDTNATFKLEVATIENGIVVSKDVSALKSVGKYMGLTQTQLDHQFNVGGKMFKVFGYISRSNKFTIGEINGDKGTHTLDVQKFKDMIARFNVA
jgi:hypothetical protein